MKIFLFISDKVSIEYLMLSIYTNFNFIVFAVWVSPKAGIWNKYDDIVHVCFQVLLNLVLLCSTGSYFPNLRHTPRWDWQKLYVSTNEKPWSDYKIKKLQNICQFERGDGWPQSKSCVWSFLLKFIAELSNW